MSEFPGCALVLALSRHGRLLTVDQMRADELAIKQAIRAYQQLSDRCVIDRTELSLEIGNLRERLKQVDPQFAER